MGRTFPKKILEAMWIYEGMPTEWEPDHIVPHSRGGKSTAENLQLISSLSNKRKGAKYMKLHEWQKGFLANWEASTDPNFLLVACPGAGKTHAALQAFLKWRSRGNDRRLIAVVPTRNLANQWREDATSLGIDLQTAELGGEFGRGFNGAAVTYQSLLHGDLVRMICVKSPTMVMLDEVHHCGVDESKFGDAVTHAFGAAKKRLLLSGTPWKTDGSQIPYVNYKADGTPRADYEYSYGRGLADGVIREVFFDYSGGKVRYGSGAVKELHDQLNPDDACDGRLRQLLNPSGDFVKELIERTNTQLMKRREAIPDACAMALCMDIGHANGIANTIREVTGITPKIFTSEATHDDCLDSFRVGSHPWCVSVRQISEGSTIKRMMYLCWLTNYLTEMFFRQSTGRVNRVRDGETTTGHVILPNHPQLVKYAQDMEKIQAIAIDQRDKQTRITKDRVTPLPPIDPVVATQVNGRNLSVVAGIEFTAEEAKTISTLTEAGNVSQEVAIRQMLALRKNDEPQPVKAVSREVLQKREADDCNTMAQKLANHMAGTHSGPKYEKAVKAVHGQFPKHSKSSLEQLQHKHRKLKEMWNAING